MVWGQLVASSVNVAYAIVGVFAILFSLVSSPIKERLYIGEASVATIAGVIFGPFCLKWFIPTQWGSETVTLQISRVVLCIQIFAVAVELPKKYMKKHWLSVFILLVPTMTVGWLIMGLFTWIIFKPLNFSQSLLISGCITATDPVLAAAVVGKGKFAQKVPGHLRNLLSAESGCNDGMAFPFIFLAMNLIIHAGNAGEIVKDWICITILYECIFGCVLGCIIGWIARRAITLAEKFGTIDRESFLAFYVMLSFACAGLGSILGVDELLVSFAAGLAFSWNGKYASKTEDAHVSTTIDLLLNLSYFVYLGALLPWNYYHQPDLGLPFWRYFLLALATIFLRRIPAVMAMWKFTPDLNTWREALFAGHFGPIGVGAIYAVILARSEVEEHSVGHVTGLTNIPEDGIENFHLIIYLWPVVSFLVVASIVVHGSSVAVIVFGRRLRTMSISMTFTKTQANPNSESWMSRLPRIETSGRSFSSRKVNNKQQHQQQQPPLSAETTIETSGIPARPAGGLRRRKKFKRRHSGVKRQRPKTEKLDLNRTHRHRDQEPQDKFADVILTEKSALQSQNKESDETSPSSNEYHDEKIINIENKGSDDSSRIPTAGYQEGNELVIEDQAGEVMSVLQVEEDSVSETEGSQTSQGVSPRRVRSSVRSSTGTGFDLSSLESENGQEQKTRKKKPHMSSLEKIRTNLSAKMQPSSTRGGDKYIAYRVRDEIIIENNDGEILKRYKIHNHDGSSAQQQPTTPTLRQRAMSLVGFKPQQPKSKEEYLEEGGSSAPILVPETEGVTREDNALMKASDNKIQKKLLGLINDDDMQKPKRILLSSLEDLHEDIHAGRRRSPAPGARPNVYDFAKDDGEQDESDSEYDTEDGDEDDIEDNDDDDGYEETEAERVRRMGALGLGNTERDAADEEDDIPLPAPTHHRKGK